MQEARVHRMPQQLPGVPKGLAEPIDGVRAMLERVRRSRHLVLPFTGLRRINSLYGRRRLRPPRSFEDVMHYNSDKPQHGSEQAYRLKEVLPDGESRRDSR